MIDTDLDDDALLAELGVEEAEQDTVANLRHVRTATERREAEEIATRDKCVDFATFKPLFEQVQKDLDASIRQTRPFELKAEIKQGSWFIVGGQKGYVAEAGEMFMTAHQKTDSRLRVVYDNGTESNFLVRSLQRALHRDEAGRRITDPEVGPLFSGLKEENDLASGTIYVLRSKSGHPLVAANRDLVHKIGVTGNSVEQRIAGANMQPTFLMADVEVVATYQLFNISRTKMESLFHKIFQAAKFEIEVIDRFGIPKVPCEWFLLPLFVIDEAVEKIKDGSIVNYIYDPESASLKLRQKA